MNQAAVATEAMAFMKRVEQEPEHVLHVAKLAVSLFDQLQSWHKLNVEDRTILMIAAWLHDIGWTETVMGKGHHKASARMIRDFPWTSLSPQQVERTAMVARYHRKSLPKKSHADFMALPGEEKRRVKVLSSFLRLGDALDRKHLQLVTAAQIRLQHGQIALQIASKKEASEEVAAAEKKGDLLEELLKKPLKVKRNKILA